MIKYVRTLGGAVQARRRRRKIDACVALGGKDDAGGIHEGLFVRVGGKPIGNGIGTNGGNLDAWSAHNN